MGAAVARVFRVKNFERFQHYKDRKPPWVKLYRDLWLDCDFLDLSPASKLLFIGFTTLASVTNNRIPDKRGWISAQLGISCADKELNPLIDAGFLFVEQDASNMLHENDSQWWVETETETEEKREETEKNKSVEPEQPWLDGDSVWLHHFLVQEQHTFNSNKLPKLVDSDWWAALSVSINGISPAFIRSEFAKMELWLRDNPSRGPTERGVRRFVSGWLERAAQQRRKEAAYGSPSQNRR